MIQFETIFTPLTVRFVHECHSRKSALQHAAEIVHQEAKFINSRTLLEKFIAREEVGSTVIDDSKVALPHCRMRGCQEPIGALLRFKPEVPFGNAGGVALAFALVVPLETNEMHLQILRTIALVIRDAEQLEQLLEARSESALRHSFLQYTRQID